MMSVVFSVTAGTATRLSLEMEAAGEGLVETASLDGIESDEPEDEGEREKRSDAQIAKDNEEQWGVLAWAERQVAAERDAAKSDAAQGHWGGRASVSESRKAMKVPGASP